MMSRIPYASAIGPIMYAMICIRPDVSYALSMTSRYQANLGEDHWTVVKNIMKYLRRTKEMFLVYGGEDELIIKGYSDANFQSDRDDCSSQSGFVFTLNSGAVTWRSSKQSTIAASLTTIYLDSVIESAIVLCFELLQVTAPPFKVNTKLDCEEQSFVSHWKLASKYPLMINSSSPLKTKNISLVLLRYFRMFLTAVQ